MCVSIRWIWRGILSRSAPRRIPGSSPGRPRATPRVTFTSPEIAQVGLTEQQARKQHEDELQAGTMALTRVDRAVSEDDTRGFRSCLLCPAAES